MAWAARFVAGAMACAAISGVTVMVAMVLSDAVAAPARGKEMDVVGRNKSRRDAALFSCKNYLVCGACVLQIHTHPVLASKCGVAFMGEDVQINGRGRYNREV